MGFCTQCHGLLHTMSWAFAYNVMCFCIQCHGLLHTMSWAFAYNVMGFCTTVYSKGKFCLSNLLQIGVFVIKFYWEAMLGDIAILVTLYEYWYGK